MNEILFKTILLKGEAGDSITSIEKTSTSGIVDTYTITLTNGETSTFEVTNGSSIASIEKTATVGIVDTYTITLTNGETSTFEVTNGSSSSATEVSYSNTTSGLTSETVQGAIDEVVGITENIQEDITNAEGEIEQIKSDLSGLKLHTFTNVTINPNSDGTFQYNYGLTLPNFTKGVALMSVGANASEQCNVVGDSSLIGRGSYTTSFTATIFVFYV